MSEREHSILEDARALCGAAQEDYEIAVEQMEKAHERYIRHRDLCNRLEIEELEAEQARDESRRYARVNMPSYLGDVRDIARTVRDKLNNLDPPEGSLFDSDYMGRRPDRTNPSERLPKGKQSRLSRILNRLRIRRG